MAKHNTHLTSQRVASFKLRRRSSVSGKSGAIKWPHSVPSPQQLADAGFYFDPAPENPDNATCFLCGKSLDGWEPSDNPITEHLRHSPTCGWAITAAILAEPDVLKTKFEPHSDVVRNARLQTFGDWWPHQGFLNAKMMADAGWHCAPSKDSVDHAQCPYCGVSVDGFEEGDDPLEEHRKRGAECLFFSSERKTSFESVAASKESGIKTKTERKRGRSTAGSKPPLSENSSGLIPDTVPLPQRGRKRSRSQVLEGVEVSQSSILTNLVKSEQEPQRKRRLRSSSVQPSNSEERSNRRRTRSRIRGNTTECSQQHASDEELEQALERDLDFPLTDESEKISHLNRNEGNGSPQNVTDKGQDLSAASAMHVEVNARQSEQHKSDSEDVNHQSSSQDTRQKDDQGRMVLEEDHVLNVPVVSERLSIVLPASSSGDVPALQETSTRNSLPLQDPAPESRNSGPSADQPREVISADNEISPKRAIAWVPVEADVAIDVHKAVLGTKPEYSLAPEKTTVHQWVQWNASQAEMRMRNAAELMVVAFESEGMRAISAIESVEAVS